MTDLTAIKQRHEELYDRYLSARAEVLANAGAFAGQAEELIGRMEKIAAEVTCREDYDWLRMAVEKWRAVFTSALNIPRDFVLEKPRSPLKPAAPREERMIWGDNDLDQWLRDRAFDLAKARAVSRYKQPTPEEMLRRTPSTPKEAAEDWEMANAHLACEILDGRICLTQIRPKSYGRLEDCWLEDVKRLKAYFNWLNRGGGWGPDRASDDYLDACNELQLKVMAAEGKRPECEFGRIRYYIEAHYLTPQGIDPGKVRVLIGKKARRLWEKTGNAALQNWAVAEGYVNTFYGSIVPAVCGADTEATRRVSEAVCACEPADGQHLIINAFEAAVAVAFLPDAAALASMAAKAA